MVATGEYAAIVEGSYPKLPAIGTVCYVRPRGGTTCLVIVLRSPEVGHGTATNPRHFVLQTHLLEAAQLDGALRPLAPLEIMAMQLPHPDAVGWVFSRRR